MDIFDIIDKKKVQEALKNKDNEKNDFVDYLKEISCKLTNPDIFLPDRVSEEEFEMLGRVHNFLHNRSIKTTKEFLEILSHPDLKTYRDLAIEFGFNFVETIREKGTMFVARKLSAKRKIIGDKLLANDFLGYIDEHIRNSSYPAIIGRRYSHLQPAEINQIRIMSNFLRDNPNITQDQFMEMLEDKRLTIYKSLVKEYGHDDFVEKSLGQGFGSIAAMINANRELTR